MRNEIGDITAYPVVIKKLIREYYKWFYTYNDYLEHMD